jgi:hypothetical protein
VDERSVIRRQPALGRRNALRFSALPLSFGNFGLTDRANLSIELVDAALGGQAGVDVAARVDADPMNVASLQTGEHRSPAAGMSEELPDEGCEPLPGLVVAVVPVLDVVVMVVPAIRPRRGCRCRGGAS